MRNKPLQTILLFLLLLPTVAGAEVSYVAADVLVIRETPSKKSRVLGLIPYGTVVQFDQPTVNADGLEWVKATDFPGYLARAYVSPTSPAPFQKRMVLRSRASHAPCHADIGWSETTLALAHGVFTMKQTFNATYAPKLEMSALGTYTIAAGFIELKFTSVTRKFSPSDVKEEDGTKPIPNTVRLHYSQQLEGYFLRQKIDDADPLSPFPILVLPNETKPELKLLDRKKCAIIRREKCEPGSALKEYVLEEGFLCP